MLCLSHQICANQISSLPVEQELVKARGFFLAVRGPTIDARQQCTVFHQTHASAGQRNACRAVLCSSVNEELLPCSQ